MMGRAATRHRIVIISFDLGGYPGLRSHGQAARPEERHQRMEP
jgi:hypothetical protein